MAHINLNNLKITHVDWDLYTGFFWIEFDNGKNLQCCLLERDGKYHEAIVAKDTGADWGMCEEANEWAVDEDTGDWDQVVNLLLDQADNVGIHIIY